MTSKVEFRDLRRIFGKTVALDGLDLTIEPGEFVALLGPSGCGKTTALRCVAGFERPDSGAVLVDGKDITDVPANKRDAGMVFQSYSLFPNLNARDNVAFGLRVHGAPKPAAAAGATEWLRRVGLEELGERRPAQLSGGQQQRVALARALATAPAAILLDEPLTSLDTETAGDVRALLHQQLVATRTTAVVATHDAVDAVALATRLVVLEDGRVTQSGPVRDVLSSPATRFAAAVAGLNRVVGEVDDGAAWRSGGLVLPHVAAGRHPSPVAAVVRPGDVRVVARPPAKAGEWAARIQRLEQTPAGVRLRTADPDVAVDLTADRAPGLAPGEPITLQVDPADVRFIPAP